MGAPLTRVVLAVLATTEGVGALVVIHRRLPPVSYGATSHAAEILYASAGFGLTLAGLLVGLYRRAPLLGDLALLAAITWFAPVWVGWQDGPPLVRSVAAPLSALTLPLLVHITVAFPSGRVGSRLGRAAVGVAYVEAVAANLAFALFRDPYLDPRCWANCTINSFLVDAKAGLVRIVDRCDRLSIAAVGGLLVVYCLSRLIAANRPTFSQLAPVLLPAAVLGGSVIARQVRLQQTGVENPFDDALRRIFFAESAAVTGVAAGLVWSVLWALTARRALRAVAVSLAETSRPGALQDMLRSVVGDRSLRVHYWSANGRRYVDAAGVPSEPADDRGRSLTHLTRAGQLVATVSHGVPPSRLEQGLGAALLLGVENERLRAEMFSQLEDLRASRARVVAIGDEQRRQLERDLHDGAQQHVLALTYDLRMARATLEVGARAPLDDALRHAEAALGELRDLAHGIFPAVLERGGLGAALESLGYQPGLVVEIDGPREVRHAASIEAAAYFAVAQALEVARMRAARYATVRHRNQNGTLEVHVEDDGVPGRPDRVVDLELVADRVGAIGGTVEVGATQLVVRIPCG